MPDKSTVFRWLSKHETFRDQYTRASEDRAAALAEDILEIADEGNEEDVQRAKLRIDTRKWLMSKMAPKRYSDKVDHTLSNPDGSPVVFQTIFETKPDK